MFAYVGSFTTPDRAGTGRGIEVYRVDPADGGLSHIQTIGGMDNPSFLALSRDQRVLYAVHGGRDYASAYALDPATGLARPLGRASTGGTNGVKQDIDRAGRFMLVANYVSGNLAVLGIRADGALADHHDLLHFAGELGPHRVEQARPQPHDVVLDPTGGYAIVPDKGLDTVFVLRFDADKGRAGLHRAVRARPGAGPRHVAFHPTLPMAYVCNELDSTVTAMRWDAAAGELAQVQVLSSLPEDFFGANTTSELDVARDGRFLRCSNRGHDSVVTYAIDPASGRLCTAGWTATGGAEPRFVCSDPAGRFFYAANQNSHSIVVFAIDAATGRLSPTGRTVATGSPVSIVFAGGA
ncbi:MAG: lactonase family protein [Alphaproteobacteria bacterium]